jgi:hypothetical protein
MYSLKKIKSKKNKPNKKKIINNKKIYLNKYLMKMNKMLSLYHNQFDLMKIYCSNKKGLSQPKIFMKKFYRKHQFKMMKKIT